MWALKGQITSFESCWTIWVYGSSTLEFCGTVVGSGTHAKGSTHSNSSVCGSSAITPGKFTETLAQFGSPSDDFDSKADAPNINGTTASIFGYLVDSNEHRASNTGEVEKLEGYELPETSRTISLSDLSKWYLKSIARLFDLLAQLNELLSLLK